MEQHLSSKTNKPHNKGECAATEAGCLQQLARQDPQGEEAATPHTPTIPHTSLNPSYRVASSVAQSTNALLHSNTSNICTYSTSYGPSLLSSASYASINNENSGSKYRLDNSYLCDAQSNQPRSDLNRVPPNMNNSANISYDVTGGSSASLLPEHFSQLSQNAQQQILEQILSAHSTSPDASFTRENNRTFHTESGRCVTGTSRDSGIVGDLRGQPPDRHVGVGGTRPPESSSSSIVVSLPNHSSSLYMPESPGHPNQNESNASICSSNNTLVIHGSDSPDSPWSHKWSSALQHNSRTSNLSTPERVPYGSSGGPPPPPHQASALLRPDHHLSRSVSLSQSPATLSTQERVLNYISGQSTDITDIPNSLLDQSQVLKHLLTATNNNTTRSAIDTRNMNPRPGANEHLDSNRPQILNSSISSNSNNHYTSLLKSSVSIGQSDRDVSFNKIRPNTDGNNGHTGSFLGASKLTSKSSSSGSVYSSHLDNVTPTSGYSSASASTQFSLNRSALTTGIDDGLLRYSMGPSSDDLPPPPAYPHWRLDKPSEPPPAANDHLDSATARENLRDISLGRGTSKDLGSAGREETPRGRGLLSGVRDTRRDLSLGPEFGRMTISSGASRQNTSGQEQSSENNGNTTAAERNAALSRSQPDLTRLNNNTKDNLPTSPREMKLSQRLASSELPTVVDLLFNENTALRLELELYNRKVNKLQKFETEILKVHAAHESLVQICTRREQLEKLARTKLQTQVAALTKANLELEAGRGTEGGGGAEEALRRELNRRDVVIAQLVAQNKEMLAAKERLEMEVTAQKQTLHEQRTHIDVLDSALANAQANIVKLEDEVRVKQGNVVQLQQAAADRRQLQADQDMHQRLQREMLLLRYQQCTGRLEGAKLSTETLERELQAWEQQQTMLRLRQQQLHLQHNRDRHMQEQQSLSQQRTASAAQGARQQHPPTQSSGTHQQLSQQQQFQQQQQQQQQQLPAPRRDEELGEILL